MNIPDDLNVENSIDEGHLLKNFILDNLGIKENEEPNTAPLFMFEVADRDSLSLLSRLSGHLNLRGEGDKSTGSEDAVPPALTSLGISDYSVLSIGSKGGGLPPHKHAASWLGLILGLKQWTLLPPHALSPVGEHDDGISENMHAQAALNPPLLWSEEVWSALNSHSRGDYCESANGGEDGSGGGEECGHGVGSNVLECTQDASEVMYIPPGWWHSTVNLGDSIGVGGRAKGMFSPGSLSADRSFSVPLNKACVSEENCESDRINRIESPYIRCAAALSDLCNGMRHLSSHDGVSNSLRQVIAEITRSTPNKDHMRRGGNGLQKVFNSTEEERAECNVVAHREILRKAVELEPFNIKHILRYAESFYQYPIEHLSRRHDYLTYDPIVSTLSNPAMRSAKFIRSKVRLVHKHYQRKNIMKQDARQLVRRMGLFLDALPASAGKFLACPNTPHLDSCGTWGMNHACEAKLGAILNETVRVYMQLDASDTVALPSGLQHGGDI